MTDSDGLVYVLTNEAMPGLVKIGVTLAGDAEGRAGQLYSTGVPLPFDVEYAARVSLPREVERALHNAFRDRRVNPKREFFRIEPDQAVGLLAVFGPDDVTEDVARDLSESVSDEERRAVEKERQRRPPLNFDEMGIPLGAELSFVPDPTVVVTVAEAKKVKMGEEIVSLSQATRDLLGLTYYVAPTRYWTYEGRSLQEIYGETYSAVE
jgi:hypothetical protein